MVLVIIRYYVALSGAARLFHSAHPVPFAGKLEPIVKEALNNSSMNYQSTKKISAILSFSSFSVAYQPLKMATHPCVAETLN